MKKIFKEILVHFLDEHTRFWSVDAYRSDDQNEAGSVIAWIDDRTGTAVYADPDARADEAAQAAIGAKVAEIKSRLEKEAEAEKQESAAFEMALAECVFDIALESMRCVPGLGDGTADSRAVFQAVYAAAKDLAAKALAGDVPASYPLAAVSAAMGVASKFGGPAPSMRLAVRDGERAELVRPLAGGLELSANVDTEEGEFAVSVMSEKGTVNELDLALVSQVEVHDDDAVRVRVYTDEDLVSVSCDEIIPVSRLMALRDEEVIE